MEVEALMSEEEESQAGSEYDVEVEEVLILARSGRIIRKPARYSN